MNKESAADQNINELLNSSHTQKWQINDKFHWSFFDERTFSEFSKDDNSPSYTASALGTITDANGMSFPAQLNVTRHDDIKMMSAALFICSDPLRDGQIVYDRMFTVIGFSKEN